MSSSRISKEVFLRDADDILRQKGLLDPIRDLFSEIAPIQGSSATDKETQIEAVLQREG